MYYSPTSTQNVRSLVLHHKAPLGRTRAAALSHSCRRQALQLLIGKMSHPHPVFPVQHFWLDLPQKLAQLLCDFSGLVSLAREGPRRQITERRVRPSGVVVLSPTFDPVSGVVHR